MVPSKHLVKHRAPFHQGKLVTEALQKMQEQCLLPEAEEPPSLPHPRGQTLPVTEDVHSAHGAFLYGITSKIWKGEWEGGYSENPTDASAVFLGGN